jgi:uncharacterized protein (TIGR03437 family)
MVLLARLKIHPAAGLAVAIGLAGAFAQEKPAINVVWLLTAPDAAICPGCLMVITGSALGPSDPVRVSFNDPGGLPTTLAGFSVRVNGWPALLASVSATRIVAVAPFALDGQTPAQVQVSNPAAAQSDPYTISVAPFGPGVLTIADSGNGQILATNADGTPNSASVPAEPGSTVAIFASGLGQTSPALPDGQVSSGAFPTLATPNVSIGGKPATVQSVTSAPGYVAGYYQVVVTVPPELRYQGDYGVILEVNGLRSQPNATLAVNGPPPPAPMQPSMRAKYWAAYWSTGDIPLSNDPDGALAFDFPVIPAFVRGTDQGGIHYLGTRVAPIAAYQTMTITLEVLTKGTPVFNYQTAPDNTCVHDAGVHVLIDTNHYDDGNGYDRWWANPIQFDLQQPALSIVGTAGTLGPDTRVQLVIPLDPGQWSSVFGQFGNTDASTRAGFESALRNIYYLGVTFGGGCFFGHGVNVSNGTAHFRLISLMLE